MPRVMKGPQKTFDKMSTALVNGLIKSDYKTHDTMTADDMNNLCNKVKLLEHFAGLYTAIVMCPYCSQHTANFAPCCKCGAPVGDTSIENDETPSQRRKRLLGE